MNIRISKLAKDLNVTKTTLWNWRRDNKIEFVKDEISGYSYVTQETYNKFMRIEKDKEKSELIVYVYARVSTPERKSNLETQAERVAQYANANGYKVHKIFKEIASGFNDNRKMLNQILDDLHFDILIVEHKDRLTRVGFNYIKNLLNKLGKEIIVINEVDFEERDIIQDFISIITSYTARIYGNGRKVRHEEKFLEELKKDATD